MTQTADPGQVVPGTQKPIECFFVVDKTDQKPSVTEFTLTMLISLFRGRVIPDGMIADGYAIFTDRTSADDYAMKQQLLYAGIEHLKRLPVEQLRGIVPAISPDAVDNTIESNFRRVTADYGNRHCE